MDFDSVEDLTLTFESRVERAKEDLLGVADNDPIDGGGACDGDGNDSRVRQLKLCAERFDFMKEIVAEARKRATLVASSLASCRRLLDLCVAQLEHCQERHATNATQDELRLLLWMHDIYLDLYRQYCVPTAAQWRQTVRNHVPSAEYGVSSLENDGLACALERAATESNGFAARVPYAADMWELLSCGDMQHALDCDAETAVGTGGDSDDGSYADEQMHLLLRRCAQLSRKMLNMTPEVRSLIRDVSSFATDQTLEW